MSTRPDTIIFVHLTGAWARFHRRPLLESLAEALDGRAAFLCVDRPITLDTTPLRHPARMVRGIWKTKTERLSSNLMVVRPRVPLHDLTLQALPWARSRNARILGRQLSRIAHEYLPTARRFVHWIYHPVQRWVLDSHRSDAVVYECYDEYTLTDSGHLHDRLWREEKAILAAADVTFVSSEQLASRRRDMTRDLQILPNGIGNCFLSSAPFPREILNRTPDPHMVCLGTLHHGWHYQVLSEVFESNPEWRLLFIGPEARSLDRRVLLPLKKLPNVNFLGFRPYDELPGLLQQMDVGLAILKSRATSPRLTHLKLFEYLASGLPVVSTLEPNADVGPDSVFMVEPSAQEVSSAIRRALGQNGSGERSLRRNLASEYTWQRIVERTILPVVHEKLLSTGRP